MAPGVKAVSPARATAVTKALIATRRNMVASVGMELVEVVDVVEVVGAVRVVVLLRKFLDVEQRLRIYKYKIIVTCAAVPMFCNVSKLGSETSRSASTSRHL